MTYIAPARAKRMARQARKNTQVATTVAADTIRQVGAYRAALQAINDTTAAIKVPNGTTKKIARIVGEALATA